MGVDRIQRSWGPLRESIEYRRRLTLNGTDAHAFIYRAFIEQKFPVKLLRAVHRGYFVSPSYEEFREKTIWLLENAFTTAFKELKPAQQSIYRQARQVPHALYGVLGGVMDMLCAWYQFPLIHSWIKVGNTWVCAECLDEVASLIKPIIKKEYDHEEVAGEIYGPATPVSDLGTGDNRSGRDAHNNNCDRNPGPVTQG